MSRIEDIKARVAAATPGPWNADVSEPDDVTVWTEPDPRWVANVGNWARQNPDFAAADQLRQAVEASAADAAFIAHARTDIPDLLRVVEAARLVKAQCDDMCPSWYDEPCDCGMDALRSALADLDR